MLLLVNVDDISGEKIPHLIDELMARGAASVHVVQALTKKGRLEYLFLVDTPGERIEALGSFLVAETGTIGMRVLETRHIRFDYRIQQVRLTAQTEQGPVQALMRVKEIYNGDGRAVSVKAEYEDLRAVLTKLQQSGAEVSFTALKQLVEQAALGREDRFLQSIHAEYLEDD
jgi:uncharacterized protein (DUF111 family)